MSETNPAANLAYDPRIYLAAERTALSWNRTALAWMVFGFVVERTALAAPALGFGSDKTADLLAALGVAAVAYATWVAFDSARRGARQLKALSHHAPPDATPVGRITGTGWLAAGAGFVLAVVLTYEIAQRLLGFG